MFLLNCSTTAILSQFVIDVRWILSQFGPGQQQKATWLLYPPSHHQDGEENGKKKAKLVGRDNHKIMESLSLKKTSKTNSQSNTTMPAKPCPDVPYLHAFLTPPGMVTPPLPVPMPDSSFSKDIFPKIQSKLPVMQLKAISCCPVASYLGEETNTCFTTNYFQVVVESIKVSPQPSLL